MSNEQLGATHEDIRLRPDPDPKNCQVLGCYEFPSKSLPERMQVQQMLWCRAHADLIAQMISARDYKCFELSLGERVVKNQPVLVDTCVVGKQRRCCVPKCKGDVVSGLDFSPHKIPGIVWVCAKHAPAVQDVLDQLNGPRLIHELRHKPRSSDAYRVKRRRAIRSACARHKGKKRNYIEAICQDLQREKIRMPERWFTGWDAGKPRIEPSDWLIAFQTPHLKLKIQKHISQVCSGRNLRS